MFTKNYLHWIPRKTGPSKICGRSGNLSKWHGLLYVTHRENCVLINSVREFIEIEAWLLLNFFLCLHNQLISIHSIVTYKGVQIFQKSDSSNRQKWMVAFSQRFIKHYSKIWVLVFVLTQENALLQRFYFKTNKKSIGSCKKTVLVIFKIAVWEISMLLCENQCEFSTFSIL